MGAELRIPPFQFFFPDTDRPLFEVAELILQAGVIHPLVGPSGCGKSTLCQILAGYREMATGALPYGPDYCQMVPQFPEELFFLDTVRAEWMNILAWRGEGMEPLEKLVVSLGDLGIDQSLVDIPVAGLSGGYRRLMAILTVLLMSPNFLILDEPFAGLSPDGVSKAFNTLSHFVTLRGIFCLLATHDLRPFFSRPARGFGFWGNTLRPFAQGDFFTGICQSALPLDLLFLYKVGVVEEGDPLPRSFAEKMSLVERRGGSKK